MGFLGLVHLRRALLVLPLVIPGVQLHAGQSQPAPSSAHLPAHVQAQTRARTRNASDQTSATETPFDRIIGAHLAEWRKAGSANQLKAAEAARPSDQGSGIRVNAPAFVAAPYASLPPDPLGYVAAMAEADFNNDGKIDVAVAREDGTLDVMLNPGSFTAIASTPFAADNVSEVKNSPAIAALYAADLNGDSYPDLIGMDSFNSQIVVWIGNGDGTFKDAVTYPVVLSSGAVWSSGSGGSITVADFNKDGFPDVAIFACAQDQNQKTTVLSEQTFINSGKGTFAAGKEIDTTFHDLYQFPYAGTDVISNDGKTASAIATLIYDQGNATQGNQGSSLLVVTSNGDGTFTMPKEPTAPLIPNASVDVVKATSLTANFGSAPAIRKLKGHSGEAAGTGIPTADLLAAGGDGTVYDIAYQAGSGNPTQVKVLIGAPLDGGGSVVGITPPAGPNTIFPVAHDSNIIVADFDGDGYQDVVLLTNGAAYMFPNGGNAAFTAAPSQLVGPGGTTFVAADFDGDGYQSILWADFSLEQLAYLHNLGATAASEAGTFIAAPTLSGTGTYNSAAYNVFGSNIQADVAADVNGDGLLDIIASDTSNEYLTGVIAPPTILLGTNNGAGPINNEKNAFTYTTLISTADLSSLLGEGYVFQPFTIKNGTNTSIVLSNINTSAIYVFAITAKGAVSAPVTLSYAGTAPACPVNYADTADINGDGIPDIAVGYSGDSYCGAGNGVASGFFTFLGNADGTYQPGQFVALGSSIYKVKLMNLSGTPGGMDLVAIDSFTSHSMFGGPSGGVYNVFVVPGDGHGNFGTPINVAPNYIASDVIAGDFNSDGIPDLTITTEGQYSASTQIVPNSSGVLQLAGQGGYNFAAGVLVDQEHYPATAVYTDVNGDGTPDLVVSEFTGSDQLYVPQIEIYPNLGGGVLGPVYTESMPPYPYAFESQSRFKAAPVFAGNWGSGTASDLLVQGVYVPAIFLNQGLPKLSLASSSATASQDSSVTLTATLTQGGNAIVTANGIVSFAVGSTTLGSAPISDGIATLTTTNLPVGSDVVVASYTGDADAVIPTGSTTVTISALAPTFMLTAESRTVSLQPGATKSVVLDLAANATFNGTVTFTCTGAPAEATCSVNPSTLNLTPAQTGNATVVIATTPNNNQYQASSHSGWRSIPAGVSLAGLLWLIVPRRRRSQALRSVLLMATVGAAMFAFLTGCGSGNQYAGTPTGTSTLTITATSGSITQSQTISLTVTANQ